jgi:type III pantothenate kinase
MAAVVGARALYPGQACLVIDAGTCITYDYIDREGSYHGGAISPGIDMRFRALHKYTASLPHVARGNRHNLIGTSTRTSMISGVVNGTVREIEGVICSYHNIDAGIRVILCGGDAIFFEKKLKGSIFAVPDLVITGLYKIYRFNDLPVHRL